MQRDGIREFQVRRRGGKSIKERMREFRRRHPDYNRAYKAKQRAEKKARLLAMKCAVQVAEPVLMKIPVPTQLCLPAPTIDPTLVAMNEMLAKLNAASQALTIPSERSAVQ